MTWRGHLRTPSGLVAALSLILAVVAASLATTVAVVTLQTDPPWDPLGPFPEQTVEGTTTAVVDGKVYPALRLSDQDMAVTGRKCYKEHVEVAGRMSWSSEIPPGFTLVVGEGTAEREARCYPLEFTNPIPPSVKAWAGERIRLGQIPLMRISGREVAFRAGREDSLPLTWRTETFAFVAGEN